MLRSAVSFLLLLSLALLCIAQTQSAPPSAARGVIRLRVRVKIGDTTKGLSRKRFFLIAGSLDENKSVIQAIEQRPIVSRDCYYRHAGASEALIKWLRESDCESVYCREIEADDIDGSSAVPEFKAAMAAGEKEFGNREVARKWLTVNLPEPIRDGFYKNRQNALRTLLTAAQGLSGAPALSVMTDRNGTAYFTDLKPGTYVVSNILPTEIGNTGVLWDCQIQVKPGDLATEKPYLISNRQDRNVKCVGVEKPLPICEARAGPGTATSGHR